MRRPLASLLMTLANVALLVAVTAWWLQHTVFDPGRARDVADHVLAVDGVQQQLTDAISQAVAGELGQDPQTVAVVVEQAAATSQGVQLLTQVVVDSQSVLIGESEGPVQITPQQLAELLGDDRALLLPAITLPVTTIEPVDRLRQAVDATVGPAAVIAVVLLVLAFLIHPARHVIVRRWGALLLLIAVLVMALGYLVPVFVLPLLTSSPWVEALPQLAKDQLGLLAGVSLVVAGMGLALIALAGAMRRELERPAPAMVRRPPPRTGDDLWR